MFGPTRSTYAQFIIVVLIFFCAHGSFLIINGVGGGGLKDPQVSAMGNMISSIAQCIIGFFAGAIYNILGPRMSLLLGMSAYLFFAVSFLICYLTEFPYIVHIAGAYFGLANPIFWTAQGTLMLTYPTEQNKGKYITTFFLGFSACGVIGGLLVYIMYLTGDGNGFGVPFYLASISTAALGTALVFTLKPDSALVRDDGSAVQKKEFDGLKSELKGVMGIFTSKHMWILTPVFMTLGMPFAYYSNVFNFALFRGDGKGMNMIFYSIFGMIGSLAFGYYVDHVKFPVRLRGLLAAAFFSGLLVLSWLGGFFEIRDVTRETLPSDGDRYGLGHGKYWAILYVYSIWGLLDSSLNAFSFWIMGNVTTDSRKLARYTGYSRVLQGLGGIFSWGMDAVATPYMIMFWATFGLLLFSMVCCCVTILVLPPPQDHDDAASVDMTFETMDDKVLATPYGKDKDGLRNV